jgi:hypothetical protein
MSAKDPNGGAGADIRPLRLCATTRQSAAQQTYRIFSREMNALTEALVFGLGEPMTSRL